MFGFCVEVALPTEAVHPVLADCYPLHGCKGALLPAVPGPAGVRAKGRSHADGHALMLAQA